MYVSLIQVTKVNLDCRDCTAQKDKAGLRTDQDAAVSRALRDLKGTKVRRYSRIKESYC